MFKYALNTAPPFLVSFSVWSLEYIDQRTPEVFQHQQELNIEKAADQLIQYIKAGLKNYKSGPTFSRPIENDHLCDIYLNLANQFILAKTKPEDVLPVWDHLGRLFLKIAKKALTTEQQQQEYKRFETELETHKEKNYIWHTCYMHALSILVTEPEHRHDINYFNTHFDTYQIALNDHQYNNEPAWLSHLGRLNAYQKIGSEWTRNVASTVAQIRQFPDIVFLWCPFDLSPIDFLMTQPHPNHSHLSFVGFLLGRVCADGYSNFQSSFFSRHDEHHKVISDWFLSGADLVFFLNNKEPAPSPNKYWEYVREGRMVWYDCVKMFRDIILSMDKHQKSDEDTMFVFFAFWLIHEGVTTLQERLNTILYRDRNSIMYNDIHTESSVLLSPHYYFPLLPKSLQNKKYQIKSFQKEMQRYLRWFFQRIEGDVSQIKEKYKNSIYLYNRAHTNYGIFDILETGNTIHFDMSPYNSERERMVDQETMLDQYGFYHELYRQLKEKKKKFDQSIVCIQYDFRAKSPFYMGNDIPLFHKNTFNQDELSLKKGAPHIINYAGWKKEQKPQGVHKARKLYELSAQTGHREGYTNLGTIYERGAGVKKDINKAIQFYKIAIKKGSSAAMNYLGDLYLRNNSIEKNIHKAKKIYIKALQTNEWETTTLRNINRLAHIYKTGNGVKQNIVKAIKFYEMALEKKDATAMNNMGLLYQKSDEPIRDHKKAIDFYKMAIENGSREAFNNLAIMYQTGEGVQKNIHEAVQLYEAGIEKGCSLSMHNLGTLYLNGVDVQKDVNKAVKLYTSALKNGNSADIILKNICRIADMFSQGDGIEKNKEKAIKLYKIAVEKKDPLAIHKLAIIYHEMYYESGERHMKSRKNAMALYAMAVEYGDAIAMFNLSILYIDDLSHESELTKGIKLLSKASEKGVKEAQQLLKSVHEKALKVAGFQPCKIEIFPRALKYLTEAAQRGNEKAKSILKEIHILAKKSIE